MFMTFIKPNTKTIYSLLQQQQQQNMYNDTIQLFMSRGEKKQGQSQIV